jgi:hypothetical protein
MAKSRNGYEPDIAIWRCEKCDITHFWQTYYCNHCDGPRGPKRKCCPKCRTICNWDDGDCPDCGLDFHRYKPSPPRRRIRYWD